MRFGLSLPVEHTLDEDIVLRFNETLEAAKFAVEAGFDFLDTGQHYLVPEFQYLQMLPVLARVAGECPGVELATNILLLPLLNPVDVAETVSTLDVITGGRFTLGVGLGYRDVEYDAFGVERKRRLSRFLESLELIKKLWTEETVDFEGEHFSLKDATLGARPVQTPHPPILVAASGDRMVQRAARIADGLSLHGHSTVDTLARQIDLYREALDAAGKPFPPKHFRLGKELYIAKDRETALKESLPYIAAKYNAYVNWGQDAVLPEGESFEQPIEALLENRFIIGDVDFCIEELTRHRELIGANDISLRIHYPGMPQAQLMRVIELLGERVFPHFRD